MVRSSAVDIPGDAVDIPGGGEILMNYSFFGIMPKKNF